MKVDNEKLLLEKIKTGICFFTGAGFSVLPNSKGECLPNGSELAIDLCHRFSVDEIFASDLARVSSLCPKKQLDEYLRQLFTLTEYNPLYDVLHKVNLKTFVTTNIDNLIRLIIDKSDRFCLNNMREYGAPTNKQNEICYIPLHGDVKDTASELYFGKMELAQVSRKNKDLFDAMYSRLKKETTVFLGYNFNDGGVLEVISKLLSEGCHDIWVLCLENDQKNILYFRKLGCNVIEGDTESFLRWIDANVETPQREDTVEKDSELKKYRIPTLNDVLAIDSLDYYQKGYTDWYSILTGQPYERKEVNQIYNDALSYGVLVLGDRFTGKTTMLMQLALKVDSPRKLYLDYPQLEEAKLIVKKLRQQESWVFLRNCTSDLEAFIFLASQPNIHVVGTCSEYQYESVRHLIEKNNIRYKCVSISELCQDEALHMYDKIPAGIRNPSFSYKYDINSNEKYSLFEFIGQNVLCSFTEKRIKNLLQDLLKKDKVVFDVLAITFYLDSNYSAFSYAILALYLNCGIDEKLVDIIKRATEYLRSLDYNYREEDYYILRSKVFAKNVNQVFFKYFKEEYGKVIEKFLLEMNPYYILRYNTFRRSAFDANLFYELFSYERSMAIFDSLINHYNSNHFLFQQRALCKAKYKKYKEAFADIDLALGLDPDNYSIRNTQAIILFEANKMHKTNEALASLKEAMRILGDCFQNDKRKIYHAQKYAEFAIVLKNSFGCPDYLDQAHSWLNSIIEEDGVYSSSRTKHLLADLERMI